jgi:hypothetical protein
MGVKSETESKGMVGLTSESDGRSYRLAGQRRRKYEQCFGSVLLVSSSHQAFTLSASGDPLWCAVHIRVFVTVT